MPQASKKRRRQAHGLAAEGLTDAPRVLDQPSSLQTHHLTAASLTAGKSPPPGRTAQEKEFANFLIGTISASPSRRTYRRKKFYQWLQGDLACPRGGPKHFVKTSSTISRPAPVQGWGGARQGPSA